MAGRHEDQATDAKSGPSPQTNVLTDKVAPTVGQSATTAPAFSTPASAHAVNPSTPADAARAPRKRRLLIGAAALVAVALAGYWVVPTVRTAVNTVSTDDAYVNGHFTFVAPRVPGQVVRVLVDDNNRVRQGDVLLELDPEPYQIQVRLKQAAVELAKADLAAASDKARSMVAMARANRFKLENAIEQVNNEIALLRVNAAALDTERARLARASADLERAKQLQKSPGAISQQEVDQRQESFSVAEAQVQEALEQVYQVRVSLGLPAKPPEGQTLTDVPADLSETFSAVRQSLAELLQSAASMGIFPSSYNLTPSQVIAEFYKRDPDGNLDRILARIIPQIPGILQAEANLKQAENDLAQAELNLSWCSVLATIDGVVTRRNVNPGNNVQVGQSLMAIRSLTEIWVDANFKETQLAQLRIGQRVEMKVDMYGAKYFPGRITGFTMGTGSTLAILPAENATGNFIKVVQRLPVRIEPVDYDPEKNPLFIGLSVVPYVYINEAATGPHAGEYLQPRIGEMPRPHASTEGPAGKDAAEPAANAPVEPAHSP